MLVQFITAISIVGSFWLWRKEKGNLSLSLFLLCVSPVFINIWEGVAGKALNLSERTIKDTTLFATAVVFSALFVVLYKFLKRK